MSAQLQVNQSEIHTVELQLQKVWLLQSADMLQPVYKLLHMNRVGKLKLHRQAVFKVTIVIKYAQPA